MSDRKSKADLILAYMERRPNTWVSVWDILRAVPTLSHTKRISEINAKLKPLGREIVNKVDKQNHSFYKLVQRSGEQLRLLDVA